MIQTSSAKRPTSLGCTSTRRRMQRCSASTRRRRSRRSTARTRCYRCRPAGQSGMALSITDGTLSLYAAFNTKTGEVLGKTAARHTSAEFVAFLADIVVNQPATKEIHVIADNLSAHKTKQVTEFLDWHPNVHLHFTPTYSSWLNQVELWFAKIERDVIARGVFTSVPDLRRKLMRYIRQYNKAPKTIALRWTAFPESARTAKAYPHRSRARHPARPENG